MLSDLFMMLVLVSAVLIIGAQVRNVMYSPKNTMQLGSSKQAPSIHNKVWYWIVVMLIAMVIAILVLV